MVEPQHYPSLGTKERAVLRQQYSRVQGFTCYYCAGDLSIRPPEDKAIIWRLFPKHFLKYPVHLHHNHKTGLTIGAVHAYCNAVLWQYHKE